jgi:hypothetical protein
VTDLSTLSDADLQALYANPQPADVQSMVTAEAQRQGVDPALALRVANQESRYRQTAVSPKGAIGVMQLMPQTAKDLGVDPTDPEQNIRGGVAYLKQQLDEFGSPQLAAAAYNAGPQAVRDHGGVPPFRETQDYVATVAPDQVPDLSKLSDAELKALYQASGPQSAPATAAASMPPAPGGYAEVGASHNRGVTIDLPMKGAQRGAAPAASPTIAQDALSGFLAPFQTLGHDVMDAYRSDQAHAGQPAPNLVEAAKQSLQNLGQTGKIGADLLGAVPSALAGAVIRPAARAIANYGPTPYEGPRLQFVNGAPSLTAPVPLSGDAAQAKIEGALNTALSGARAAAPGWNFGQGYTGASGPVPMAKPMTLDQVKAAKDAAYAKVDASGFAFNPSDVQNLADTITNAVASKGGPQGAKLYPDATAMAARIDALAKQPGGVPLSQLDTLRSDIYDTLVDPGGKEAPLGRMMRSQIDGLISASNAPDISAARDLNTRYRKMQAVSDRMTSADVRAASTYSGGNYTNAVRQQLRPLIDPTSAAQIGNLSPAEQAALTQAVTGTAGQNATRYASKLLTNKLVQVPIGVITHGAGPAVMEGAGALLNKVGQAQTNGAVQKVLDLMSLGGLPAKPAPVYPTLALSGRPAIPLASPTGLFGAGFLAALPPQIRALLEPSAPTPIAAQSAR